MEIQGVPMRKQAIPVIMRHMQERELLISLNQPRQLQMAENAVEPELLLPNKLTLQQKKKQLRPPRLRLPRLRP